MAERWDDDPVWASARARTRDEVRQALATRTLVCSNCGHEATAAGRRCPQCGEPYVAWREPGMLRSTRRRVLIGALLTAIVLGAAAAVIVPALQSSKRDNDARERRDHARLVARVRRELAIDQRLHSATIAPKRPIAAQVESAITRDARQRVESGALKGPILRTECAPFQGRAPRAGIARFGCTVVNANIATRHTPAAGVFGYPFWAKVYLDSRRVYWCKINPKPGEAAIPTDELTVPLDRRCDVDV